MFDGLYKATRLDGKYQVWYTTLKRGLNRSKSFNTIEEVTKWCKANKDKVKLSSGSWQVLDTFKKMKSQ